MFILQENSIDVASLRNTHAPKHYGAFVNFEGVVRPDTFNNTFVSSLLYIADHAQCMTEGVAIIESAREQYHLTQALCIQRIGQINAGEPAIWIGVWSLHRDKAFQGCRYIIEEVKKRLHIWKKEFHADGTTKWIHGKTN